MRENTLTHEEIIAIKFMVHLSFYPKDLVTCEECNNPWQLAARTATPQEVAAMIMENKTVNGCVKKLPLWEKDHTGKKKPGGIPIPMWRKDNPRTKPDPRFMWRWCPRLFEDSHVMRWGMSFEWLEKHGALPCEGGINDQPWKWVQAMNWWRHMTRRTENQMKKEQRDKEKRAQKSAQSKAKSGRRG